MQDVLATTVTLLEKGENVVWATVVERSGSAPRSTGSRMVVDRTGTMAGSVGGGRLEADALAAAAELHQSPGCRLMRFNLAAQEVSETDMICGGRVTLWLETLSPSHLPLLYHLRELLQRGENALLLTRLGQQASRSLQGRHLLWGTSGFPAGDLEPEPQEWEAALALLHETGQGIVADELGTPSLYAEAIQPRDRLYIFGGGHVSLDVAWFAHRLGFMVIVVDDREEFANPQRFPMAEETWALPFERAFAQLSISERDYVVIVTRGHMHDLEVLRQALAQGPRYLGMMGSRRKRRLIFENLQAEGISPERLAQVRAPIGLDIGAETPPELAVSIVAELVACRAGRLASAEGRGWLPEGLRLKAAGGRA